MPTPLNKPPGYMLDAAGTAQPLALGATGAVGTSIRYAREDHVHPGTGGPSGATGATGLVGATGSQGLVGATGSAGVNGATGATGLVGATGSAGVNGATGPIGLTGATGSQGLVGATGPSGTITVLAGTTVTERTGDGTSTAFTFSGYNGTDDGGYIVSVGGIDQPPSVYSISSTSGGTITFNEAPVAGEIISIRAVVASQSGGGGAANTGGITFSGTSIIGVASETELNNIELHPNPEYDSYGQFVVIRPTSPLEGNHIHIDKGGINASLFLGSDDQYVNLAWDGSIELGVPLTQTTQAYTVETTVGVGSASMTLTRASNLWARDLTNGSTITRVSPSGASITVSTASIYGDYIYVTFTAPITQALTTGDSVSFTYHPRKTWKFTNDGKMTFPDGSQQSTAGGGGGTSIGGQIWDVAATYNQGDIVTTTQRDPAWICIDNDNTGHDPTDAPLWWQPLPADAVSLQLRPVATTAPSDGQALVWNAGSSIWEPQNQQGLQGPQGQTGATGETGVTGATGAKGDPSWLWRGEYFYTSTNFNVGDVVSRNSAIWLCIQNGGSADGPPSASWAKIAQDGATGSAGTNGQDGATGSAGTNGTNGQGFNWRGTWYPSNNYSPFDVVFYNGWNGGDVGAYICVLTIAGEAPINPTYWNRFA